MDCPRVRYPQFNDTVEADLAEHGYKVMADPSEQVDKVRGEAAAPGGGGREVQGAGPPGEGGSHPGLLPCGLTRCWPAARLDVPCPR